MTDSSRRVWVFVWGVLLGIPLGVEIYGLATGKEWAMLSHHVVPFLQSHPYIWVGTLVVWVSVQAWLIWHWWFQYRRGGRNDG